MDRMAACARKVAPLPATAINAPAKAGPATVDKFCTMLLRTMAFSNRSLPTSAGTSAWRLGWPSAIAAPVVEAKASSHHVVTMSM